MPTTPNYVGYVSFYWGDDSTWTINCDRPVYFPPNGCLPVRVPAGITQLDGPALAKGVFVAIYADPATANGKTGLTAQWFRTSKTPFAGSSLPNGYTGPTAAPSASPTNAPKPTATPPAPSGTVPPTPNYLGYVSFYWSDDSAWTINCDRPVYFPPNGCLQVHVPAGITRLDGPALAKGVFVALYADPKTANGNTGLTAQWFRTSKTPFAGSSLPNGYTGPTAAPSASPTNAPSTSPTSAPSTSPTSAPSTSPTSAPTATPKPTAPPTIPPPTPVTGVNYPAPGWPQWTSANLNTQRLDNLNPAAHIASWSYAAIAFYNSSAAGGITKGYNASMATWDCYCGLNFGDQTTIKEAAQPIYIATNSDPTLTVPTCSQFGGCSSIQRQTIHVPANARAELQGANDGHIIIVSPDKQYSDEFWRASNPFDGNAANGMRFNTSGTGWSTHWEGSANAGHVSYTATVITAEDLLQGSINHAVMVAAPCLKGGAGVYPTFAGADSDCGSGRGAPLGARIWLNMTDAQINAVGLDPVRAMVAKAIAHYGAFVADSTGLPAWQLHRSATQPSYEQAAWLQVKNTITHSNDWLPDNWPSSISSHFAFLDPCVSRSTC